MEFLLRVDAPPEAYVSSAEVFESALRQRWPDAAVLVQGYPCHAIPLGSIRGGETLHLDISAPEEARPLCEKYLDLLA